MHQPQDKLLMFRNRLTKVYKHLSKQAQRQGIGCYRIYDHDLPEAPFIIEQYEDKLYVSEYKRQHQLSDEAHEQWLEKSKEIMAEVIGVKVEDIFLKMRKRKEGRLDQYQKVDEAKAEYIVQESGLKFIVNLSDYLDTGLFLDHRITRQMVKDICSDKRVLNLFCYTGSFSVYAASGGAAQVVSVDLSKTYLTWAERNMQLNFPDYQHASFVHADVLQYLKDLPAESFDVIVMDPPTFSNSKRMKDILDIQRDHVTLINDCLRLLSREGVLFFSTNYTRFVLDTSSLHATQIKDITKATTPFDFAGKLHRQCFKIGK
jgi:23S rRNA (cytosine1962-C5)-methyltransferase